MTKIDRLVAALKGCLAAMEMQEQRENEEVEIPQGTAKKIWDDAKTDAVVALRPFRLSPVELVKYLLDSKVLQRNYKEMPPRVQEQYTRPKCITDKEPPCGIGHHSSVGWFILGVSGKEPYLVWKEKKRDR